MDILVLNKIDGYENDIKEIKTAFKEYKGIGLDKKYSVILKHFEDLQIVRWQK